jgi:hypothetical protein
VTATDTNPAAAAAGLCAVTEVRGGDGTVWTRHGFDEWHAPDGRRHPTGDALAAAESPLTITAVADVHTMVDCHDDLVAERDRLLGQLAAADGWARAARLAVYASRRALAGQPTRCHVHGDQWEPGAACCLLPRDVGRAVAALDAVQACDHTDAAGSQPQPDDALNP